MYECSRICITDVRVNRRVAVTSNIIFLATVPLVLESQRYRGRKHVAVHDTHCMPHDLELVQ